MDNSQHSTYCLKVFGQVEIEKAGYWLTCFFVEINLVKGGILYIIKIW